MILNFQQIYVKVHFIMDFCRYLKFIDNINIAEYNTSCTGILKNELWEIDVQK